MKNNITYIEFESSSGVQLTPLDTIHLIDGKIFLEGDINMDMANDFLQKFLYLSKNNNKITV